MEDLNVKGMLSNHSLAKAIQEVGFSEFKLVLQKRAFQNNKQVVLINRYYPSSKTCNKYGYINKDLKLNTRYWYCPKCGEYHDRDKNAAINILHEGRKLIFM